MLAAPVLASGITHLTDARYFAAWEVNYLAFPLGAGNPESISWDYLNALREWVEGPEIVAELGEVTDVSAWVAELTAQNIGIALLSTAAPASAPEILKAGGVRALVRIPVEGYQSADDVAEAVAGYPAAEAVVLDFESGGVTWTDLAAGHPFGVAELQTILAQKACLLRIDVAGTDPKEIVNQLPTVGFAVRGSSEEKVGYKSFDDLDDLFEGLEVFE